jgi:hypothetical protein
MRIFTTARQTLLLGVCALGAALVGAAVFGQSAGQPTKEPSVNKPKVAVKKATLDESHFEVLNARKPIKFQPFTLAELQKKTGNKKLTANSDLRIPHGKTVKKVKVQTYLESLNKVEKKLNSYGYSLRHPLPKGGGVQLRLKTKTTKEALQKERDRIAKAHHKVTPEKEKLARAHRAKPTKKELQAKLAAAKKTHAKFEKWRKTQLAKAENKLDPATLTPEERKLHDHLLHLSKKKKITQGELNEAIQKVKEMKRRRPSTRGSTGSIGAYVASLDTRFPPAEETLGTTNSRDGYADSPTQLASDWQIDLDWLSKLRADKWDWNWNWYDGSSDTAKVYVNYDVGTSFVYALAPYVPLVSSAWGSFQVGADVLVGHGGGSFSILDTGAYAYSSETGGTHIRAHARFLGNDIFTPISQDSASGIWETVVDQDFPVINQKLCSCSVPVGPFTVGGQVQINGDVHVTCSGIIYPTATGLTPSVTTNLTVTASVGFGALGVQVAVEGTMTLLNDELDLWVGDWILFQGDTPTLYVGASVKDNLSMLGGKVDLVLQYFNPFDDFPNGKWDDTSIRTTLFSWPNWVPVSGYLLWEDFNIPLQ